MCRPEKTKKPEDSHRDMPVLAYQQRTERKLLAHEHVWLEFRKCETDMFHLQSHGGSIKPSRNLKTGSIDSPQWDSPQSLTGKKLRASNVGDKSDLMPAFAKLQRNSNRRIHVTWTRQAAKQKFHFKTRFAPGSKIKHRRTNDFYGFESSMISQTSQS